MSMRSRVLPTLPGRRALLSEPPQREPNGTARNTELRRQLRTTQRFALPQQVTCTGTSRTWKPFVAATPAAELIALLESAAAGVKAFSAGRL